MSRHQESDHVVMDASTGDFWCKHCDARHKVKMPLPISEFVKQSGAFTTLHAKCQKEGATA